jgi:hypothetical protein
VTKETVEDSATHPIRQAHQQILYRQVADLYGLALMELDIAHSHSSNWRRFIVE